jgi:hypothetical protein
MILLEDDCLLGCCAVCTGRKVTLSFVDRYKYTRRGGGGGGGRDCKGGGITQGGGGVGVCEF